MFGKFKYIKSLITIVLVGALSAVMMSCDDEPANSKDKTKDSTLLVYAVATNSLTGNLVSDKNEMLQAAPQIDLENNNVLVFETQYKYLEDNTRVGNVSLQKISVEDGAYVWETVKEFNDGIASLDPRRMTEVIDYIQKEFPSKKYNLVLWSHSTGSQPYFVSNSTSGANVSGNNAQYTVSLPEMGWFGQDLSVNDEDYKYMNIDVLANTLPDHLFDYIWFDSCYMSNIESIYQLRNKCNTYVGYPTEVLDSGLPYQYVLPYMLGHKENLIEAAKTFYEYYSNSFGTVAVVDMNKIDVLVDFCKSIFSGTNIYSSSLVKYSRYTTGPFYDLGDYVKAMAKATDNPITDEEWAVILDQFVLYKATTDGDLLRLSINPETYSGLSTHLYSFAETDGETESYYKSLDWFKTVFQEL